MSDTVPLQIDVNTLKAMRQSGAEIALLDVREPWEFDLCAIEGSMQHSPRLHCPSGRENCRRIARSS